jgi:hypothetical protein
MYVDENPSNDQISKSPAASIPTQGGPAPHYTSQANHVVSLIEIKKIHFTILKFQNFFNFNPKV